MKKVIRRAGRHARGGAGKAAACADSGGAGELVGAAREGLLALSVGVGLSVVHELMEAEVTEVVGPRSRHDPERTAKRHGHERGSMTLGGRRGQVSRPRIRTADDRRELAVETYEYFADRDPLTVVVMNRMLAGVSTRRYAGVSDPVGEQVERQSRSTGKSTVSELFIERTRTALEELMGRRLEDVRLAVMMLDGIEIADRCHVVALGITTDGVKIPLGLWEGSTENATLARSLLSDLVERGLDPEQAILLVVDGGKAIRRAIKDVFGEQAVVLRCHRNKERNVTDLLPERDRPQVLVKIRGAWALTDADLAEQRLERLASELERTWPDAAASLREGLPETLTLMRLGIGGQLAKSLCSTNPCKSRSSAIPSATSSVGRMATCASAGPPPACSSPSSNSGGSSATATSPSSSSRSSVAPPGPLITPTLSPTLRSQKPLRSDYQSTRRPPPSSTTIRASSDRRLPGA
jgi:putative transposase